MRNEKKMYDNTIIVRHEITINENSNKFMFYDTEILASPITNTIYPLEIKPCAYS